MACGRAVTDDIKLCFLLFPSLPTTYFLYISWLTVCGAVNPNPLGFQLLNSISWKGMHLLATKQTFLSHSINYSKSYRHCDNYCYDYYDVFQHFKQCNVHSHSPWLTHFVIFNCITDILKVGWNWFFSKSLKPQSGGGGFLISPYKNAACSELFPQF